MARTAVRGDADGRGVPWEDERRALLRQAAQVTASPALGVALLGVLSRGLLGAVAGASPSSSSTTAGGYAPCCSTRPPAPTAG